MNIDNIAILTSGGDSQGMNTVVSIIVRVAKQRDMNVFGIKYGYKGLCEDDFVKLDSFMVENTANMGGTVLKTSRYPEFLELKYVAKAVENLKKHKIDALIVVGGDGSFRGARTLSEMGVNVIAIPATVDNDLRYTDNCLGFDTAVNNATEMIDKIKQTMISMDRGVVFEVMGRYCGDIALYTACASACDIIAVPEKPISQDELILKIKESIKKNKRAPIVVIAEKMFDVTKIVQILNEETNYEFKYSVIGYIQRGGEPSVADRVLSLQFAVRAIDLISKGIFNKAIGTKNGKVIEMPIDDALHCEYNFNYDLLNLFYLLNN